MSWFIDFCPVRPHKTRYILADFSFSQLMINRNQRASGCIDEDDGLGKAIQELTVDHAFGLRSQVAVDAQYVGFAL